METRRYRLAVVAIRPEPYQAALFRLLAAHPQIDLTVYYLFAQGLGEAPDRDFGRFAWGYPVLDGYRSQFLLNRAPRPSTAGFTGSFHPELFSRLHPRQHDAAILPGWFPLSAWLAHWACRRHDLPVLLRTDSNAADPVRRPWLKNRFLPRLFRRCHAFLTVGTRNAEFYRRYGVPEEKLFLAPHAVDNDFFAQQHAALRPRRAELRRRLGVAEDALLLVYAGRLAPEKRLEDLLEAVQRLNDPRLRLALVGEGRERARLERRAAALGPQAVLFPGFQTQTQLAEFYTAADVFVLPSEREPWGLALNEAMNFALPVVVSERVGAAPDLVGPENGRVFPPRQVGALADCLRPLAADAALRARLGEASRRRIRAWSHARSVETYLRALDYVTRRPRP